MDSGRDESERDLGDRGQRRTVKRRSRSRWRGRFRKMPLWAQEYWIEIALTAAILIAIFLLVEPWDIRVTVLRWVRGTLGVFLANVGETGRAFASWFRGLTLSDATAFLILAGVLIVAIWRVRWRVIRTERLWNTACPRCKQSDLHRIHRRFWGRVLGALGFPVARYRCGNCDWKGLRIRRRRGGAASLPRPPAEN